ncbi:MAG TPA: family 16 glycoside hydrolase, partial [Pirellulaceae bacterium]|nr:family 16 glycoside hydrolase [Pirellulaceae bacterium]
GHAHAGCMLYQGGAWPEKYRGAVFMNNIHGNRMNIDLLEAQGSGFVAHHGPDFLLTRDQWSQMLSMTYGPDGQVWVIDWYDMQQCHLREPNKHDRSNGRIYRIAYDNAKPVKVDLQKLSDEELVKLLAHANQWYVRHALRILQERAARKPLADAIQSRLIGLAVASDGATRVRGYWALHVTRDSIAMEQAPFSINAYEYAWRVRLPNERPWRESGSDERDAVWEGLKIRNAGSTVRLGIASAIQRLPLEDRWGALAAITEHEDAADHNLPLMYWYAMEPLADVDPARALALGLSAGERIPILKEYMIRKIGAGDPAKSLALLVDGLKKAQDDATRLTFLRGMNESLKGRKGVNAPDDWQTVSAGLAKSDNLDIRFQSAVLSVNFGDEQAAKSLAEMILNEKAGINFRKGAIQVLAQLQSQALVPVLVEALGASRNATEGVPYSAELRTDALRGLAAFDDARVPPAILGVYGELSPAERRDALTTLCARPAFAKALLDAVAAGKVPANHLTADLVTNLRNLNDEALSKRIEQVWGIVRSSPEEKQKLIADYKRLLTQARSASEGPGGGSLEFGRAIFAKTCANCHTLFGSGAKIGPDITGSQRANLDYLLTNLIDPSAVMAKEYQPLVVRLLDGRVVTGLKREETAETLALQTANELVVISKADIDESKQSDKSLMPDDQLLPMSPHEVRSLVAYLGAGGQTPILATADNVGSFYDGKSLAGWVGDDKLWNVENGEIVGKTAGLAKNEFLISELSVGDFKLELDVKLVEDKGNSGIQIRSQPIAGGEMRGYQADIGPGWWGKLYEEHGRALLEAKGGEEFVKKGDWNHYEIIAAGSRVRTWLNGHLCVDRDDALGARSGVIAVQLHSGGATEVRYKNLKLTLISAPVPARPYPASKPTADGKPAKVSFKKTTLDRAFRSEGVGMGDFNNDGLLDISAGSVWYENPGIQNPKSKIQNPATSWPMHVITEKPNSFDIKTYGDTFMNWAEDLDGDGRQDLIVVDFPGKQTWWFQNPGTKGTGDGGQGTGGVGEPWRRNVVVPVTNDESPLYLDIDGDGRRELIFGDAAQRMSIARPQSDPLQEWKATPISTKGDAEIQRFYHGLGVGDINKDGRNDVIAPSGWWENVGRRSAAGQGSEEPWIFHPAPFGPAQAQMYVFDFDGDGDNDVVGSSAHQRGIWWYEQASGGHEPAEASGDSRPALAEWTQHKIDDSIAQTHALILADINGDGLPDLVTGKRYYAHNGRDPGEDEPPEIAWYELSRKAATSGRGSAPAWTKHVIDADSGVGTQFEVHDMNADGLLDVIVANKHGVYYFEQVRE